MIAPELGFPTGGSCLMRAEIPVGWHTGKHLHGEEAIYVESGEVHGSRREAVRLLSRDRPSHPVSIKAPAVQYWKSPVGYLSGLAWHLRPMFTWGKWNSLKIAARTTRRFYLISRRVAILAGGRAADLDASETAREIRRVEHGTYFLMGRSGKQNGFKATGVAISSIFVDLAHTKSHSHAHPEAYLYALEGDGYSRSAATL